MTGLPPAVLWADPGGLTGIAALIDGSFSAEEREFRPACDLVHARCSYWRGRLWIGWETYVPDPRLPQNHARDAIEPIGAFRYLAMLYGCRILPEAPRHTPVPAEQARLKALGWWRPGEKDSQSASCHLLRWLMQTNSLPPREAGILAALRGA